MSFILENRPINEVNNKDREHFLSLEVTEDYSFKVYILSTCMYINVQVYSTTINIKYLLL